MSLIQSTIDAALRKVRLGFYHAKISSSPDEYRRHAADAEWGPNIQRLRRIASPILDIVPAIGTRMAVLSQDGVPEFGALLGQVWDNDGTPAKMTAWLRANLQLHPGYLELGGENGLRIIVGSNSKDITPPAAGSVVVNASLVELGGESLSTWIARADRVESRLQAIETYINSHEHNYVTPLLPSAPAPTAGRIPASVSTTSSGDTAADNVKGK